jgi:chorismate mutase
MNFTTGAGASELLALDHIRAQLIRLEDTIIFCQCHLASSKTCALVEANCLNIALIERAQFALNAKIYEAGAFENDTGFSGSWLEWFLFEIESFHGRS